MGEEKKMIEDIKQTLLSLKEEGGYKEFSQGLVLTNNNIMLGIRLPVLRTLSGKIVKNGWRKFLDAYDLAGDIKPYYEEVMLQGMVINAAKMDIVERLALIKKFIPKIDNWAICDTFCCGAKWVAKSKEVVWDFLKSYLKSDKEFEVRYGVIMILANFLDKEYINRALLALDNIESVRTTYVKDVKLKAKSIPENYYVDMAVAWCLATAAAKCRDEFFEYIKDSNINNEVLKKMAQKMRDSYRVSAQDKKLITERIKNNTNNKNIRYE